MHIDATTYRSPNYNTRPVGAQIEAVVVHTTEGAWPSDIRYLCDRTSGVSAHYVIAPDGPIYALVDDGKRAWHAGESAYAGRHDYNSFSLGIELSHLAGRAWDAAQRPALTMLCRDLIARYPIARPLVVPHRLIVQPPGRKADPSDWSDADFRAWADALFLPADPLRVHVLPGADHAPHYCGSGFHDFYTARGGLGLFGLALTDEHHATDARGHACTIMLFERAIFKYIAGVGVHLALLAEARACGWLT